MTHESGKTSRALSLAGLKRSERAPQAREILAVEFTESGAELAAGTCRAMGRVNVRVHREKIRAESTWRWGWVVVADARKEG